MQGTHLTAAGPPRAAADRAGAISCPGTSSSAGSLAALRSLPRATRGRGTPAEGTAAELPLRAGPALLPRLAVGPSSVLPLLSLSPRPPPSPPSTPSFSALPRFFRHGRWRAARLPMVVAHPAPRLGGSVSLADRGHFRFAAALRRGRCVPLMRGPGLARPTLACGGQPGAGPGASRRSWHWPTPRAPLCGLAH